MKALKEKIANECSISRKLRENAWEEKDFDKSMLIREKQQEHWEKYNFMRNLNKALEKEGMK